ncbi:nibrin [Parambassis ranga]|uniref:Nibrin n=1 Tax=Parambassis ranga TaxID=210632 RepID=A0A6P7JYP4_9TELE|nr:nibrin [Parambassis ranga]
MWILTPLHPGGNTHYLLPSKEYVVGRKNCDILLPDDQSISRAHASLTVTDQTLTLKDTSKYGTFVNNERLTVPLNLKSGDNVTFGIFQSKFSVDQQSFIVCSSCLDSESKTSLSRALSAMGGKLVNMWTKDCTHLTTPSIKVNIKTISALLCCRPIVKPEFFSELNNAVQQRLLLPKVESFIPEIDEPILSKEDVNLGTVAVRQQLFTGKTFIFLTAKQMKRLSAAVSFGGGRSQLLEVGSLPRDLLESPQSCLVDVTTGSSQVLLASSTTEWASSAKSIVERSGLRVITESEIGFAAIYASSDKYCNPSCSGLYSGPSPQIQPRLPSASLSQNMAVDETVLPAASQNITAYVVNTEPSQGIKLSEVTAVPAVGETPEKKQIQNSSELRGSKLTAPKAATQCIVADTMNSSYSAAENTDSQRKKPASKLAGITSQPSTSKTNVGMKTSFYKQSPQKSKTSTQVSPQKQSTLTTFFQPVNKKRPLEDEPLAVMSEPKRPILESCITVQPPHTPARSEEMPSPPNRSSRFVSQSTQGTATDLFTGRSQVVSEEQHSRKRKEMEEDIEIEELESIMSLDMDDMDDEGVFSCQKGQPTVQSSTKPKQVLTPVKASSSKRQRVRLDEKESTEEKPEVEKNSNLLQNHSWQSERRITSGKIEQLHPKDSMTSKHESSKPSEFSAASTSKSTLPLEEDKKSYVEDLELLSVDLRHIKEETNTPLKPVVIKQEVEESKVDEDLPKKLLVVEFRSLTVRAPPKTKPQPMQNGFTKNFKKFHKSQPGTESLQHVIRGSDLLVHNRGKNSDLDEWLKDAAEEERQNKRDETAGDDLFRYNPTKLSKRR